MDGENFNPILAAKDNRFKALERAVKELKTQLSVSRNERERLSNETKGNEVRRSDVKRYEDKFLEQQKLHKEQKTRCVELTHSVKLLTNQVARLKREKESLKTQNSKLTNKLSKLGLKPPSTQSKRRRPRYETF